MKDLKTNNRYFPPCRLGALLAGNASSNTISSRSTAPCAVRVSFLCFVFSVDFFFFCESAGEGITSNKNEQGCSRLKRVKALRSFSVVGGHEFAWERDLNPRARTTTRRQGGRINSLSGASTSALHSFLFSHSLVQEENQTYTPVGTGTQG